MRRQQAFMAARQLHPFVDPASSMWRRRSPVEVPVLLVTISLRLWFCTFVTARHQSLDEQALALAMLAAGGMPSLYLPPSSCAVPRSFAGLSWLDMERLVQE
jgi:hypothetical protein